MRTTHLLLAIFLLAIPAVAQTVDLDKDRLPIAPLPPHWRFHTGDNPAWANPDFDDSGWSLLKSDRSWADQGYLGYEGFAWYRFQLIVPASLADISINPPIIFSADEIYADGVLIGSYGKMPPHPENWTTNRYLVYKIPAPHELHAAVTRKVTVAIRVYFWNTRLSVDGGGPLSADGLLAGETSQLQHRINLNSSARQWSHTSFHILGFLRTLTAIGIATFFLLRRKDYEYLWFSLSMFFAAIRTWLFLYIAFCSLNYSYYNLWLGLLGLAARLTILGFYRQLLQPRMGRLFKFAIGCVFLEGLFLLQTIFLPQLLPLVFIDGVAALLDMSPYVWLLPALFTVARHKSSSESRWVDARLLLTPVLLSALVELMTGALEFIWDVAGLRGFPPDNRYRLADKPFPIEIGQVTDALWLLGVFAVLVLRFARTRSEQERFAIEVEGARSVQQFLIPADLPTVPGLIIESDYRPAREVGGDFFQIIPNPADGSALVFVGDVAGKGMQAGMLATLLVGAMRTAATFTRDPAIILSTLNNRLHGKGNATCLVLNIEAGGAATLVNAGHLPPYLNGLELPMEGALPLGTIPNLDFPILNFHISPGDTLTLISDGILEAQKPDGELFGFDRILQQLHQSASASHLATAAQNFGQEDDITVLTIARAS